MADQTSQNDNQNGSGLPGGGPSGTGRGRLIIWVIAGTLLALWAYSYWGMGASGGERISYSEFRTQLQQENVERVEVKGNAINGTLKSQATRSEQGNTVEYQNFVTYLPSFGDEQLMDLLESQGVNVVTKPESSFPWGLVIMGLLPVLLLFGVGYIFLRRMQSQGQGLFSVRQSKAELYDKDEEDTTFDDVAGADSAKEELREIIKFLKNPKRFEGLGGKVPKGVLLVGPPGTGKTLLARAVAGEANAPFFSVSGSDFMEMFVGVGASRVRDMFSEAKETAPAIIFIDELDSIGRKRGAGLGGGNDEREQTLNQLLSELDGFEENEGVIVMAATNRPDILDSALTRPGRFDRQITVDLPTKQSRHEILKIHARNKPLSDDVDLEEIARSTPGFSGADLENLLNEAALLAGRYEHEAIRYSDIEEARDKVMMGLKRDGMVLDDEEKRLLAYHEAGHAIVGAVLPNADPVHKVTIVPRGKAMGVTQQLPEKDKYLYRLDYILDRLAVIMGGRAAEELIFDTATSGAENDLKQVRKMARKMVLDWGMGDQFKHISLGEDQGNVFLGDEIAKGREYSDDTAREVDEEIRRISEDAFQRAVDTLTEHREAFDQLAEMLIEREEVPGKDVLNLVNGDTDEIGHMPTTNGAAASEENGSADDHEPDEATVIEEDGESGEGRASGSADASGS
ncbi:ATP-dependent zinc metalloprotease FtsH [Salinibacter ruber]|uniref:ATP-dependent zinc metalloprotease FtsH n=1 Tax=Salinibacter ruber TaxID=146919 RepID=UPI000E579CAA|nr:ATP-dependent zinc metalloprotease FtsH [Salinibacter ruber]MCS3627107.1 cell division protease FtsH [Salinibacter ruber]MCS3704716.1 cell division protease FtsH [Salinibacter ruber]MCS3822205.1 cell division protease FtsH [Salinibacter ruber]MCS3824810.1 cell division protease FtsH [Salinibacter ruber]MCS4144014.1 cell division protease FtsH [Salinibacter ruber]